MSGEVLDASFQNDLMGVFLYTPDERMFASVLDILRERFQSRFGYFGYINRSGDLVCPSMTREVFEKCNVAGKDIVFQRKNWGGLWGRILKEKVALYKNEPHHVPDGHLPLFRSLGAPILFRGELIGQIHLANRERDYDETDKQLLIEICNLIAPILGARLQRDQMERELRNSNATLDKLVQEKTAQLKLANDGLLRANAELEQVAAVAAHDLRSPMKAVLVWADMLNVLLEKPQTEEVEEALGYIRQNARKAIELINDILELARLNIVEMDPCAIDLNPILKEITGAFDTELKKTGGKLTWDPLPKVKGNSRHLESLFSNLIRNAITYREKSRPLQISITFRELLASYEFAIKDNGIGIEPKNTAKIFKMFTRLHRDSEYPGTGIGLAYCKKVIELCGGRIWVESTPGVGSTFFFTYPKNCVRKNSPGLLPQDDRPLKAAL